MFGDVVMGIPHHVFEEELKEIKKEAKVTEDSELSPEFLSKLVMRYKKLTLNTENYFLKIRMSNYMHLSVLSFCPGVQTERLCTEKPKEFTVFWGQL